MSQYYLMAQLPSLDGISETAPLPITEDRFCELCNRFLSKKSLKCLNELTLCPPKDAAKTGSNLIDNWNEKEKSFRKALASVRAEKLSNSFDTGGEIFAPEVMQAVRTATEFEDPLIAEQYITHLRLNFLETLRPSDAFCDEAVYYYGLKLKLLARLQAFDEKCGRENYKKIYDSILLNNTREVKE